MTNYREQKREAEYRLGIKRDIKRLGFNLTTEQKRKPTEELLKIKDLLINSKLN